MSNYDELTGVDMTRDIDLPVSDHVKKQTVIEHRVRGKISVLPRESQIEQHMPVSVPHVNNPKTHVVKNDIPEMNTDYSMEKEV